VVEDVHSRGADRVPARRRTLLVAQSGLVNETTEINRTARRSYRPPLDKEELQGRLDAAAAIASLFPVG
jgi:hypothetical protein